MSAGGKIFWSAESKRVSSHLLAASFLSTLSQRNRTRTERSSPFVVGKAFNSPDAAGTAPSDAAATPPCDSLDVVRLFRDLRPPIPSCDHRFRAATADSDHLPPISTVLGYLLPPILQDKYYLCDAAYAHIRGFMAPYRNVRYWLEENDSIFLGYTTKHCYCMFRAS
ncbi:hypothetical protein LXL04_024812 [Taraxacum kok-saghyz]